MAVSLAMLFMEIGRERVEARARDRSGDERYGQLIGLAPIADIGGAQQRPPLGLEPRRCEHLGCGSLHFRKHSGDASRIERGQTRIEGTGVVALQIACHDTERGKRARRRRYDTLRDLQFGCDCVA